MLKIANSLTIIRAASGVYDFRNFEKEKLKIALSNKKL